MKLLLLIILVVAGFFLWLPATEPEPELALEVKPTATTRGADDLTLKFGRYASERLATGGRSAVTAEDRIRWNSEDGTLEIDLPEIELEVKPMSAMWGTGSGGAVTAEGPFVRGGSGRGGVIKIDGGPDR